MCCSWSLLKTQCVKVLELWSKSWYLKNSYINMYKLLYHIKCYTTGQSPDHGPKPKALYQKSLLWLQKLGFQRFQLGFQSHKSLPPNSDPWMLLWEQKHNFQSPKLGSKSSKLFPRAPKLDSQTLYFAPRAPKLISRSPNVAPTTIFWLLEILI